MGIIASTIIVFVYALTCLTFGLRLTRLVAPRLDFAINSNWMVVTGTAFLLGQGVMAAIWEMVALAGMFTLPVVTVIGLLAFLSGLTLLPPLMISLVVNVQGEIVAWWRGNYLWKLVVLFALVLVFNTALFTYMPPQPRGDALAFYMSYPRLIAATGDMTIIPLGYEDFTQVGLQGEFHYAAIMLFDNLRNPDLFTLLTALAGIGMLIALADRIDLGRRGKWILVITAFTSSAFTIIIWDGKVDIFGAAMGLAAYCWAFRVSIEDNTPLRLSGLFTGLAIIAKISYAVFLPLTIALIVLWRSYLMLKDKQEAHDLLRKLVSIGLVLTFWGIIPAVPNVIKNTVLFNRPLAPIISENNDALVEQSWFSAETTNRILVTYPFSLTFGNFWGQGGQISPLILAFAPLILLLRRPDDITQRRNIVQIGIVSIVAIVIWIMFRASVFAPRYMLSPLLLWFIPVAFAAEFVTLHKVRQELEVLIPFALIVTICFFLYQGKDQTRPAVDMLLGRIDECGYEYTNSDGSCRIAQIINNEADEGARVLLASYFTYWLRPDLAQCSVLPLWADASPEQVWEYIRTHNIRYLIVDMLTHGQIYDQIAADVPEWATIETFFDESTYLGIRISMDQEMDITPTYHCVETSPNIWQSSLR